MESNIRLGPNVHAPGDCEEVLLIEKIALEDEGVKEELAKFQLPEGTAVVCDPWIYGMSVEIAIEEDQTDSFLGSDGVNDDRRMYQCFLYTRDPMNPSDLDSNFYAFPLALSPVVDAADLKVVRIEKLPTGAGPEIRDTRASLMPPANEYTPEHQELRTDLKPLNLVQPEGASFKVSKVGETGEIVEWQKWSFRVGFNQREGMVLYDVRLPFPPNFLQLRAYRSATTEGAFSTGFLSPT